MNIFWVQSVAMLIIILLWSYMLLADADDEAEWRKWFVMITWLVALVVLIGSILAGVLGYVGTGHDCICS